MTAAAGCKLSMGSANAEPGPAEPQPGGRSRRPPPAARSGAWGSAERRAQPGAEPGAASGSGSTAADGAGQRLPSRLGKSFPDPNGVKTHTKKIHCISILPKKGRFTLTPSTGSSFLKLKFLFEDSWSMPLRKKMLMARLKRKKIPTRSHGQLFLLEVLLQISDHGEEKSRSFSSHEL
ncbi:uncharacterized protein LOC128150285 isoform X2 [Harpia harpyja]|uniref:uncharacterized protein LOC128150285 isoform X2 n=1 Tax=Harpia harpyja TaxID=202280 RepID=UPI0022B11BAA|nr:uncharacterized protein LOC128150285 isoform X2 [Harpia harpyja]